MNQRRIAPSRRFGVLPACGSWRLLAPALLLTAAALLGMHGLFGTPSTGGAHATPDLHGHAAAAGGSATEPTAGHPPVTAHATEDSAAGQVCRHGCLPAGASVLLACLAVVVGLLRLARRGGVTVRLLPRRGRAGRQPALPVRTREPRAPSLSMLCVART